MPLYLLIVRNGYFPSNLTNYQEIDDDAARMLREGLCEAHNAAIQSVKNAKERWTRDYDKVQSRFRPQRGELVFVWIIHPIRLRRAVALAPRWNGLVRVIKQIDPVPYLVQDPYTLHQELKCHINQSRRYIPQEESSVAKPPPRRRKITPIN